MLRFVYRRYKKHQKATQRKRALRQIDLGKNPNEAFLVSFPKSGNTWLRTLLSYVATYPDQTEISFKNIHEFIPDSHIVRQLTPLSNKEHSFYKQDIKLIKSHDTYHSSFKNIKVIYLVREGKAVIKSYYKYLNARKSTPMSTSDFLDSTKGQAKWGEHVEGWLKGESNLLLVKYEDLKNNTKTELIRILEFLDTPKSQEAISYAIAMASLEKMKEREERLGYYNDNRTTDGKKLAFVGKGSDFSKDELFTAMELTAFEKRNLEAYTQLNYKTDYIKP